MRTHFFPAWILLFFITAQLHAQEVKVEWSPLFSETEKGNIAEIVTDNTQIYVLSKSEPTISMQNKVAVSDFRVKKLDYSLKQVCSSLLTKPATIISESVRDLHASDEKLIAEILSYQEKAKAFTFKLPEIDKALMLEYTNCKLQPKAIDLTEMANGAGLKDKAPALIQTNRKDRMVLFAEESPVKGAVKMQQGIILLDENFNQLYSAKIEVEAENSTLISEIFVRENDDVIIVMSDARGVKMNFIEIYQFSKGREAKRNKVELTEIAPGSDAFHLLSDGNIGWAGFYTKKGPSMGGTGTEGLFYLKINPETGSKVFSKFQMLTDLDAHFKKNVMGLGGLGLLKIFWTDDDAIVLVTEKQITPPANSTNQFYNELSVVKFNAQGSYQWATVIPKEHVLTSEEWMGRYFSTVGMLMDDNKTYLLFNGNSADTETTAKSIKNFESSQTVLAVIDANGKLKRIPLYSNESDGLATVPMFFSKGSKSDEFIFVKSTRYAKTTDMAKLKYKVGKIQVN